MPKQILEHDLAPDLTPQSYEQKPVDNFGLSLLQSMGYTADRGIGRNQKNALSEPLVLKARPRGLGLGAELQGQQKKPLFAKGDLVVIKCMPHDGLIGLVIELKQQILGIELQKSGSIVKVDLKSVNKITKQEADKMRSEQCGEKKKKRLKWVMPNLRVKIIDKKSNYYLKKGIITEVLNDKEFQLLYMDEDNQRVHLNNLREKDIQTVIPKEGGQVVILNGTYRGERGSVVGRSKGKIVVETVEQFQLVTLQEDDVCEYVNM